MTTPGTIDLDDLPEPWRELRYLLVNMQKCGESKDAKGLGMYAKKLMKWRDANPEHSAAFVEHITRGMTVSQPPE